MTHVTGARLVILRLAVRRLRAARDAVSSGQAFPAAIGEICGARDWVEGASSRFRQSASRVTGRACLRAAIVAGGLPKCPRRGQTELMRVVVTLIGSDGTLRRRMIDTAASTDTGPWEELLPRALAALPRDAVQPQAPAQRVQQLRGIQLSVRAYLPDEPARSSSPRQGDTSRLRAVRPAGSTISGTTNWSIPSHSARRRRIVSRGVLVVGCRPAARAARSRTPRRTINGMRGLLSLRGPQI
jgi:hypothetical protein